MCDRAVNNDIVYARLKNEINAVRGRQITLNSLIAAVETINMDMPAFLQSPDGQAALNHAVFKLVSENLLTPVGKPVTASGLRQKYKINKKTAEKDAELVEQIVRSITPPAKVDYYLKNPRDYVQDKPVIEVITGFLKREHSVHSLHSAHSARKDIVTVNERAYQLFGDEKFFKGAGKNRSHGQTVLKRLALTYADMACEETVEPFFSFLRRDFHALAARNIFIVENKDTFWSFKKQLMDCPSRIKVDMLIYGEGKKIISSFRFVAEYGVRAVPDRFYYFGDLDPEGINIYCELLAQYPQYQITPFHEGYQAVLEIGLRQAPVKTPAAQKIKAENIALFTGTFAPAWGAKLQKHLEGGFYIPQEALSAAEMKERFGTNTNGGI